MAFDLWVKESARLRAQLETQRRESITAKSAATKAVAHLKARRKTPNRQRRRSGISSPSFSPAPPPSPPVYATPRPVETQPYYSHRHRQRPQYDRGRDLNFLCGAARDFDDPGPKLLPSELAPPAPWRDRAPSCLRPNWPERPAHPPFGPTPDAPFQDWQRALRRHKEACQAARAREWAYRGAVLAETKLMTPSKIVPWHVDDGSASHRRLASAIEALSLRAADMERTPPNDEALGRALTGWGPFLATRAKALALDGMEVVVN